MDAEEMLHVFRINTVGPLLVVQQLLKRKLMGTQGVGKRGAVVGNVTSKVGSVDDNGSGKGTPTARPSRRSTLSTNP